MSWFSMFAMFWMVMGYIGYGWASGVNDTGGRTVFPPWTALAWAAAWTALTVTEIGWL